MDVQRLGVANDFCRIVENKGKPRDKFLACALAGTEGLDSYSFRTPTVAEGLKLSRDDYVTTIGDSVAYCRILRKDGGWASMCNVAALGGFRTQLVQDVSPPAEIARLLRFYSGILIWYRMHDDILDYAGNTTTSLFGGIKIDETPSRRDMPPIPGTPLSEGLKFNGEQYMRIGENTQLQLGFAVPVRTIRTYSFWVRFDKFTNWTRIFDFSEGQNKNAVFCGIEDRGNPVVGDDELGSSGQPLLATQTNEVCRNPTEVPEVAPQAPQLYMGTSDEFACPILTTDNGGQITEKNVQKGRKQPISISKYGIHNKEKCSIS